jgi:integral membrane sensor domain MASE1
VSNGPARRFLIIGAAAALYFGAAQLGFAIAFVHGTVSAVWVPTGLALVFLVLGGRGLWPAIVIGEFVANVAHGTAPLVSLAFGFGDALEAIAGRELLLRAGFRPELARVRDVFALLLASVTSTVVGATIGTLGLIIGTGVP